MTPLKHPSIEHSTEVQHPSIEHDSTEALKHPSIPACKPWTTPLRKYWVPVSKAPLVRRCVDDAMAPLEIRAQKQTIIDESSLGQEK